MNDDEEEFTEEEIKDAIHRQDPSKVTDWRDEKSMVSWKCHDAKQ